MRNMVEAASVTASRCCRTTVFTTGKRHAETAYSGPPRTPVHDRLKAGGKRGGRVATASLFRLQFHVAASIRAKDVHLTCSA
jgi:hypothetical protein